VIIANDGNIELTYQCKECDELVTITLPEEEWIELKKGYPFDAVFGKRKKELQYFKLGVCKNHE